jgi:hypothetical protein
MLSHDLATTIVAERDRAIREAIRARRVSARPSVVTRIVARFADAMRALAGSAASRQTLPRERRGPVPRVSARAGGTHGQGAC